MGRNPAFLSLCQELLLGYGHCRHNPRGLLRDIDAFILKHICFRSNRPQYPAQRMR
jgi:hypothetical protein